MIKNLSHWDNFLVAINKQFNVLKNGLSIKILNWFFKLSVKSIMERVLIFFFKVENNF